jgi:DNA invertase Pin-like site-specific DNA recombinase
MKYGYARISTGKQKTDRQIDILEKYNLDRIYADVVTGSKFDRPEYKKLTEEILREGDELYIKEVDRLGRNKRENLEELRKLKERGIIIRILEIPTTLAVENNQTEQNKMLIEMMNNMLIEVYTTFAELELQKIRTRTKEALAAKKERGETLGRPKIQMPKGFKKVYKQYKNRDITAVQAMKLLDLKKTTFYKLVKEYEELLDLE